MRRLERSGYAQRSVELIDLALVSFARPTMLLGYLPVWALYILAMLSILPMMK